MDSKEKRSLKPITSDVVPNVLIKEEPQWQVDELDSAFSANKELAVDMESLQSIMVEEDFSCATADAFAAQQFILDPQTPYDGYEYIKTELMPDQEFLDDKTDFGSGSSSHANNVLAKCDAQQSKVGLSDKAGETSGLTHNRYSNSQAHCEQKFECDLCLRFFKKKGHLKNHLNTHSKDRRRKFACHSCDRVFYTKRQLMSHMRVHAGDTYDCQVCGAGYAERINLKKHLISKHMDETRLITLDSKIANEASIDAKNESQAHEKLICEDAASFTQTSQQHTRQIADWHSRRSISDKKSETREFSPNMYSKESKVDCEQTFKCDLCPRSLKDKKDLKRHMSSHAKGKKRKFDCNSFRSGLYTKNTVVNHKKYHTVDAVRCEVCEARFTNTGNLKVHMLRKHIGEAQQFAEIQNRVQLNMKTEEKLCVNQTNGELVLNVPIKQENSHEEFSVDIESLQSAKTEDAQFTAIPQTHEYIKTELMLDEEFADDMNDSDAAYYAHEDRQRHLKTPDEQQAGQSILGKDNKTCNLCHNIYPKALMKTHMRLAHSKRTFECKFCGRCFKHNGSLKRHMIIHAKDRKRSFTCHLCRRGFYTKENLTTHLQIHAGNIYNCKICGKRFTLKGNLRAHMHRQHSQSSVEGSVNTKTKLISDGKVLHEENSSESACYAQGSQQSASVSASGQQAEFIIAQHSKKIQKFTPSPQNDAVLHPKKELLSDDNGKESVFFGEESQQPALALNDDQRARITIAAKDCVTCEICHNIFSDELIKTHMCQTNTEATYKCEECPLVFAVKSDLEKHSIIHDNNCPTIYSCGQCGRYFRSKQSLSSHLITHSKDRKREFACSLCDSAFYTKGSLLNHTKIHKGTSLNCELCGARFTFKGNLKRHIQLQHPGRAQQLTSDSQKANDVSIHTKVELTSDEEFLAERNDSDPAPFLQETQHKMPVRADDEEARVGSAEMDNETCAFCNKVYPKQLIQLHIRLAHCERTYKCELCSRVFNVKSNLERHTKVHDRNRPRNYACDECGSKFFTKLNLKRHLLTHAKDRQREFACNLCERTFYSQWSLDRHMPRHTGDTHN